MADLDLLRFFGSLQACLENSRCTERRVELLCQKRLASCRTHRRSMVGILAFRGFDIGAHLCRA